MYDDNDSVVQIKGAQHFNDWLKSQQLALVEF